jgi:TonB family protein
MAIRVIIEEDEKFAADFDFPGLSKGGFISLFLHASIFFLVAMVTHQQKKAEILLTEITLVDQIIPIPEEEEPPPLPVAPPQEKNVWDFLKKAIPLKVKPELASDLPMDLPKKDTQPEMAQMPDALKLGSKKELDKPIMDRPLDLVGRKAVKVPAGMNVNPLRMNKRKDSLAMTSQLPSGIKVGKKSSFLPSRQGPIVNTQRFARRANLQARGGSLADMPSIKKPEKKQAVKFDTSNLSLQREQNTFQIFGPLKDRPILEKYLPRYPRWAEEQGIECSVSLHFFVLPDGEVKNNIFIEQSSGYSEMDRLAMKALTAFRFAPLASNKRQEEQEGVIIFYFRLSR